MMGGKEEVGRRQRRETKSAQGGCQSGQADKMLARETQEAAGCFLPTVGTGFFEPQLFLNRNWVFRTKWTGGWGSVKTILKG